MSIRRRTFIATIGYLFAFQRVDTAAGAAGKPLPIPRREYITTTWIGYPVDYAHEFYRLELQSDGSGLLAYSYYASPATLYRVRGWTLKEHNIEIPLEPVDLRAEPIYLNGTASENGRLAWLNLTLTYTNRPNSGPRQLRLFRESDITRDIELTTSRMREETSTKK